MGLASYLQFALALVFVIALIGVFAVLARRFGLAGVTATKGGQGPRIGVVEVRPLDAKRKLVLVRRDGVEHLLILGPAGETVVEAGIAPPKDFAQAVRAAAAPAPTSPVQPDPRQPAPTRGAGLGSGAPAPLAMMAGKEPSA